MADSKQPSATLVDGLDVEITRAIDESTVIAELLELDGKQILDVGCGRAAHTRAIAEAGRNRTV
ncbi:MAG: Ethanolamine utilization protein EutJ (predicted chaperonin), partial [Planctomycetota bacterium]